MRLSVSKIKTFKSCRRKYELRYIEHLYPVQKSEALEVGSNYHKLVEMLCKGEQFKEDDDFSKTLAMARAYEKYIYPKLHIKETEKWFEYSLGDGDVLVGQIDGITQDGEVVEHKTYGGNDSMAQYEYNLQWDEQILAYMLVSGARKVYYTVCRKPTIRQKKNESDEEFFRRMCEWYDDDTENKIRLFEIYRTDDEIEQFRNYLNDMLHEMYVSNNFYKNTCACGMYGRKCEYAPICLEKDLLMEYVDFVRKEGEYEPTKNRDF